MGDAALSDAPSDAMTDEFDVVPLWTMEAVRELGADHAVPAACRGSASPASMAWLGEACELAEGGVLVDVGAGMGGPAAYASARFGVRPALVEPMRGACVAASTMFGLPVMVADGEAVPLSDGAAEAVWCLGVVCTTPRKTLLVKELRRLLRPGGALGLLAFTADLARPDGAPEGNSFPTLAGLVSLLADSGFEVVEHVAIEDFPDEPLSWTSRGKRVAEAVERAHGADPRHAMAEDQAARMGTLLGSGTVQGHLIHARAH